MTVQLKVDHIIIHNVDHIILTVHFRKSDFDFSTLSLSSPLISSPTAPISLKSLCLQLLTPRNPYLCRTTFFLKTLICYFLTLNYICFRLTLQFLHQIGIEKLNAHLLDVRMEKLRRNVRFLESLGFEYGEMKCPAILGYGIENNLLWKFEYLVMMSMERSVVELKVFSQYFGSHVYESSSEANW